MIFVEATLSGAFIIDLQRLEDDRGFFARSWCQREFGDHGLKTAVAQANVAFSRLKGTLRGMHYQVAPNEEAKLVRCTRGAVYDVIIDLRPESATHRQWIGVELAATHSRMIYVPEGFGHGYQTLTDNAEICYQASQFYAPESARGVRYNDPTFGIEWPIEVSVISANDRTWPDYLR